MLASSAVFSAPTRINSRTRQARQARQVSAKSAPVAIRASALTGSGWVPSLKTPIVKCQRSTPGCISRCRSRGTSVIMAAAATDSAQDAAKVQPYRLLAYAFVAASIIPMANPALVVGASAAPAVEAIARAMGACQVHAAFSALALAEAAEHGRLTSDTYRRLNLALLLQAALLAAGAVQGTALPAAVCQAATAGAVATAAICGWGYVTTAGVPAAQTPAAVLSGTAEVPRALLKGLTAGGYATYYSGLILSNLPLLIILIAATQYAPLVIASGGDATAAGCARLCGAGLAGAAATLYVNMDAAMRDRLSASTFRSLNWASVLNAVAMGAIFFKPLVTGGIAEAHKLMIGGIGAFFFFIAACTLYILQNTQKKAK